MLARSVGGTGAMKSTSPASSAATRVAGSLIGVSTILIDIAGRVLVPVIGEAVQLEPHPLLPFGHMNGPVPPACVEAKDAPCLTICVLRLPALVLPE